MRLDEILYGRVTLCPEDTASLRLKPANEMHVEVGHGLGHTGVAVMIRGTGTRYAAPKDWTVGVFRYLVITNRDEGGSSSSVASESGLAKT